MTLKYKISLILLLIQFPFDQVPYFASIYMKSKLISIRQSKR
ncbi:hypothetical protein ACFPFV_11760 [Salinicoccus siamensis]